MIFSIRSKAKKIRDVVMFRHGKDIDYGVGQYSIKLPYGHNLPGFQRNHPKYDRFLPHLAKYLPSGSCVVDVGANCADTFAGMFNENPSLNFICVEADDFFFSYLEKNVKSILSAAGQKSEVRLVKSLAGAELSSVVMTGVGGTKHAVPLAGNDASALSATPLDEILNIQQVSSSQVSLVKTDTDGYDYDVINSANSLTRNSSPLLFMECQYETRGQFLDYKKMISSLEKCNYSQWAVFDNFGALMLVAQNSSQVYSLMDYTWQQNNGSATRTIFYLDILAGKENSKDLIEKCLSEYS